LKATPDAYEQGDDPSLVDFHCSEYSDGKTVANEELREQILEFGIRKTARATNTDSKTIMLISKRERVKPNTLAKAGEFFSKRETQKNALQRPRT
jgi:hypothetical protein